MTNGKRKGENGKLKTASKREQSNSFELPSDSRFDGVKTENGNLRVSKSRSMVGTLRAASENDKQNGRCTQRPYNAER